MARQVQRSAAPKHFCEGAANAVWVVKNGWQIYPALTIKSDAPMPDGLQRVQWKHGGRELVYAVQVFTEHAQAKAFVAHHWTLDDVLADEEWRREAGG